MRVAAFASNALEGSLACEACALEAYRNTRFVTGLYNASFMSQRSPAHAKVDSLTLGDYLHAPQRSPASVCACMSVCSPCKS